MVGTSDFVRHLCPVMDWPTSAGCIYMLGHIGTSRGSYGWSGAHTPIGTSDSSYPDRF
jgi:hypothetical protein